MEEMEKIHTWLDEINREDEEWSGRSDEEQKRYLTGLYDDIRHSIRNHRPIGKHTRIAASLILLCGLSLLFYIYRPWNADQQSANIAGKYIIERTLADSVKELKLSDGSVIWLNEGSSLRYPEKFGADAREVFLEGEAFFQVARNTSKPFIIHTSKMQTRVLGTSFNVQAYKEDEAMRVVVVTGEVEVSAPSAQTGRKKEKVLLQASQMVTYTAPDNVSDKILSKAAVHDVEQYIAWKNGKIVFSRTSMSEVAQQLERAFGLKIEFENPAIERCKITGRFDRSQEAGLTIEAICKSIEAGYEIKNGKVYIRGQGCENRQEPEN